MGVLLFLFLLLLLLLFFYFFYFYFIYIYWDLKLMSLSATKRCHPDFNKAYSSTRLLILNGLTK